MDEHVSQIAVIQTEIANLKGQQREVSVRLDHLEEEVSELKIADQKLHDTLEYHIKSQTERWERNERHWKIAYRVWSVVGVFSFIAAVENWKHLVELIKVFL